MAGYLSDGTTVLSNLSLTGQIQGTSLAFASGVTTSTITATSGISTSMLTSSRISSNVSILANAAWASSFSAGGGQIVGFSTISVLIPAHVVQPSASSFTVGVWSGLKVGDTIILGFNAGVAGASSLSSGLIAHSHCTADGRYEFRYSNVSTLAQEQSAKSWNMVAIRPF